MEASAPARSLERLEKLSGISMGNTREGFSRARAKVLPRGGRRVVGTGRVLKTAPVLGDSVPSYTPDLLAHDCGASSGGRDARQFPKVCAPNNYARRNLARSTKHIGDRNVQIRKRTVSCRDVLQ